MGFAVSKVCNTDAYFAGSNSLEKEGYSAPDADTIPGSPCITPESSNATYLPVAI